MPSRRRNPAKNRFPYRAFDKSVRYLAENQGVMRVTPQEYEKMLRLSTYRVLLSANTLLSGDVTSWQLGALLYLSGGYGAAPADIYRGQVMNSTMRAKRYMEDLIVRGYVIYRPAPAFSRPQGLYYITDRGLELVHSIVGQLDSYLEWIHETFSRNFREKQVEKS